jgi:hypothetical protein
MCVLRYIYTNTHVHLYSEVCINKYCTYIHVCSKVHI